MKGRKKNFFRDIKDHFVFGEKYGNAGLFIVISNAGQGMSIMLLSALIGLFLSSTNIFNYPVFFLKNIGTGMIFFFLFVGYSFQATLPVLGKALILANKPSDLEIENAKLLDKDYWGKDSILRRSFGLRLILFILIGTFGSVLYLIDYI